MNFLDIATVLRILQCRGIGMRSWLGIACIAVTTAAVAQSNLQEGMIVSPLLSAGETDTWVIYAEFGETVEVQASSEQDLTITIVSPSGAVFAVVDSSGSGTESASWATSEAGEWKIQISEKNGAETWYELTRPSSELAAPGGQYGPPSGTYGEPPGGETDGASLEQMLDVALDFGAHALFPLLAMFLLQYATVLFVLRFMMRPADGGASPVPQDTVEPAARVAGAPLSFLDAGTTNGIVLTGEAHRRHRHALNTGRRTLLGVVTILVAFVSISGVAAILSITLAGDGEPAMGPPVPLVVVGVQFVLAWLLFIGSISLNRSTGNALGTGAAIFGALVMLIPAIIAALFDSWIGVLTWPALPVMAWLLLRRRGAAARALGKQDLLVLRVFGANANAASTFGTIARAWRNLGPAVTIADPSYVRYEFSTTAKGKLLQLLLVSLALAVAGMLFANPIGRMMLSELPGLSGLTDHQLDLVGVMLAFFVVAPVAVLPVFLSVWRNFVSDREVLLGNIKAAMGAKRIWHGSYARRPFYCHDDLWRPAVQQMMREAEVVLMDFRGFDPANLGCEYEIGKVVDSVPINRTVLLLDENTDHRGIFKIFSDRWAQLAPDSPGVTAANPTLKVFTAQPLVSWRDGIWRWLKSLPGRRKLWQEDAERVLAFLAAASAARAATAIK